MPILSMQLPPASDDNVQGNQGTREKMVAFLDALTKEMKYTADEALKHPVFGKSKRIMWIPHLFLVFTNSYIFEYLAQS